MPGCEQNKSVVERGEQENNWNLDLAVGTGNGPASLIQSVP